MPRVNVHNVGIGGIVQDIPDHLLPPEVWTAGQNVRFQDNKVLKVSGEQTVFDPPTVAPYWAIGVSTVADYHVLYAGLAAAYSVDTAGTHTVRTRASGAYTGAAADLWNGGVLGGILVITNNVDDPQFWATAGSGLLADLTNWPASTECRIIRPFKNFLVAFDITKSGTNLPHRIKWSHPADPGSVPSSWDETDPTKDTGEVDLPDSQSGLLQDARGLRDLMVMYKEDSTWAMQHIGGTFIMRETPIFSETGILAQRCVAAMPNAEKHFVMTGDDLTTHNGQQMESILDKRWKRWISNNMDTDNFAASYCVPNQIADEMWFCFPESGSTTPNLALIWNYKDNTLGIRDLRDARFIGAMVVNEAVAAATWSGVTGAWTAPSVDVWGSRTFSPNRLGLLQCDSANTQLLQLDSTNQAIGVSFNASIERTGLSIIGQDRFGNPRSDPSVRKLCKRIWPKASGDAFSVQVGKQELIGGPVTWEPAQTFTPGVDEYLDFCSNGRLIGVRFSSTGDVSWNLEGYDLDIEVLGEH